MCVRSRVLAQLACLLGWAGILAAPLPARAVLGESAASIHADPLRMAGARRLVAGLDTEIHVLTMADGSTIRQYLTPGGRVYAVSWNTRYKPRLDLLLGAQFPAYAQACREAMLQRPGIAHSASVRRGDLVVESSAHLNAHVGRAYLRSLLPPTATLDAIR